VVGAAIGTAWGIGQAIGGFIDDRFIQGNKRPAGEYFSRAASTVAQNAIAGAEIGLSIDLAPIAATPLGGAVVGGIGGAGFSGLTLAGESRSWSEFGQRQQSGAVGGAVVGAAVSLVAPVVGAVATAAATKVPILGEAGQALAGVGRNALGRISNALPKYQPGALGEAIQGLEGRVVSALRPNASSAAPALVAEGGGGAAGGNSAAIKPAIESAPVSTPPGSAPSSGGYRPLVGHPNDPNIPGGAGNYRGRFNAALDAEGQPRLPDTWDPHHTTPQRLRDPGHPQHDLTRGVDIDHPSQVRGVQGSREPGSLSVRDPSGRVRSTNPHAEMDRELSEFLKTNPTPLQLNAFTRYQDWRWGHLYWESGAGR